MPLSLPFPLLRGLNDAERNFDEITRRWPDAQAVTSLPANPFDGQLVAYVADTGGGVVWMLRYNAASASAYKWEFVGGSSLVDGEGATQTTSSTTYQTRGTPSVTTPLAGDYDFEFGTPLATNQAVAAHQMELGLHVNGSLVLVAYSVATGQFGGNALHLKNRTTAVAGATWNPRYRSLNGLSCSWLGFYVYAIPVRVG